MIFRGSGPVLLRNPIFFFGFFRVGVPLDPRMFFFYISRSYEVLGEGGGDFKDTLHAL